MLRGVNFIYINGLGWGEVGLKLVRFYLFYLYMCELFLEMLYIDCNGLAFEETSSKYDFWKNDLFLGIFYRMHTIWKFIQEWIIF